MFPKNEKEELEHLKLKVRNYGFHAMAPQERKRYSELKYNERLSRKAYKEDREREKIDWNANETRSKQGKMIGIGLLIAAALVIFHYIFSAINTDYISYEECLDFAKSSLEMSYCKYTDRY
jgi:hypothetical protein